MKLVRRPLAVAAIFSLLLHLAIGVFTYRAERRATSARLASQPTMQVETVSEKDYLQKLKDRYKKPEERQIVQMDDRRKSEVPADPAKQKVYLSKFHQLADQNMRAKEVGKFKNVDREGRPGKAAPSNPVQKFFNLPPDLLKAEDQHGKTPSVSKTASGRVLMPSRSPASEGSGGEGHSATDDHLRDVVVGAQTLLNTEEFKFYSFYARVREALSAQWSFRVREELTQIYASGSRLVGNEKITKVEVRLSARGDLVETRVISSSGYSELDRAAEGAFRAAAPFPHPPSDMINVHDEVSIKWDFVVYAQESGVRIQVQRGGI